MGPSSHAYSRHVVGSEDLYYWAFNSTIIHWMKHVYGVQDLEKRGLIKSVKSVQTTKKVYMLAGLEPAKEVSGGAWCAASG